MQVTKTALDGVLILTPRVFADHRGSFSESYSRQALARAGVDLDFVQDNQSLSARAGTIRGLHYQAPPQAQDKLVRVARGAILDVAVDVRIGSRTYGHWVGVELDAENAHQLLVPKGFLHGFVTRADETIVLYKTSAPYAPECDGAVHFADPDLGIDWGIDPAQAILSAKDAAAPGFALWQSPFLLEDA